MEIEKGRPKPEAAKTHSLRVKPFSVALFGPEPEGGVRP